MLYGSRNLLRMNCLNEHDSTVNEKNPSILLGSHCQLLWGINEFDYIEHRTSINFFISTFILWTHTNHEQIGTQPKSAYYFLRSQVFRYRVQCETKHIAKLRWSISFSINNLQCTPNNVCKILSRFLCSQPEWVMWFLYLLVWYRLFIHWTIN